jgi:hypothetical protein
VGLVKKARCTSDRGKVVREEQEAEAEREAEPTLYRKLSVEVRGVG